MTKKNQNSIDSRFPSVTPACINRVFLSCHYFAGPHLWKHPSFVRDQFWKKKIILKELCLDLASFSLPTAQIFVKKLWLTQFLFSLCKSLNNGGCCRALHVQWAGFKRRGPKRVSQRFTATQLNDTWIIDVSHKRMNNTGRWPSELWLRLSSKYRDIAIRCMYSNICEERLHKWL